MADTSVRLARATDAPAMAGVQVRAWHADLAEAAAMVAGLDEQAVAAAWREAVVAPPSPEHRVAVALDGDRVVGFVAWKPADDPDSAEGESEVALLVVDPADRGGGHGSRLLAAWADLARESGATSGSVWVASVQEGTRRFLEAAGWAPDGAFRELAQDDGTALTIVRLVTSLA